MTIPARFDGGIKIPSTASIMDLSGNVLVFGVTVTEVDGSPSVPAVTIRFPNGSLTNNGAGVITVNTPANVARLDTSNVFVGNQTITGNLTVSNAGNAKIYLHDSTGNGNWAINANDSLHTGVKDYTFGIHFNEDLSLADQPQWGENWESRFVPGAPPNGLFEKNWSYVSIDRTVSYRPMTYSIDLNTHIATHETFGIVRGGKSNDGGTLRWQMDTSTTPRDFTWDGRVTFGQYSAGANRCNILGAPIGGAMLNVTAFSAASGDVMVNADCGTVTGSVTSNNCFGVVSGLMQNLLQNNGAGGVVTNLVAGGTSDAWVYTGGNDKHWSFGIDGSDAGKWKLSNSTTLGTNDRLTVTEAGIVNIPNSLGINRSPRGRLDADNLYVGTAGVSHGYIYCADGITIQPDYLGTSGDGYFAVRNTVDRLHIVGSTITTTGHHYHTGTITHTGSVTHSGTVTAGSSFNVGQNGVTYGDGLPGSVIWIHYTGGGPTMWLRDQANGRFHTTYVPGATNAIAGTDFASRGSFAGLLTASAGIDVTGNITASGTLQLGNTAVAATPTPTHTLTLKDASGTTYRIPCVV